jgi:hypothetical protein
MDGTSRQRTLKVMHWALWVLLLAGLWATSQYSFLLFHTIAELFSIVVACTVFVITWNLRDLLTNGFLAFIGVGYLFVAGIDFVHTLAYSGMNIFAGFDANLPTQLWIGARYLQAFTLLLAFFFLRRRMRFAPVIAAYAIAIALLLLSVFA